MPIRTFALGNWDQRLTEKSGERGKKKTHGLQVAMYYVVRMQVVKALRHVPQL